jgi:predicted RNA polymerase sigma factor
MHARILNRMGRTEEAEHAAQRAAAIIGEKNKKALVVPQ